MQGDDVRDDQTGRHLQDGRYYRSDHGKWTTHHQTQENQNRQVNRVYNTNNNVYDETAVATTQLNVKTQYFTISCLLPFVNIQ